MKIKSRSTYLKPRNVYEQTQNKSIMNDIYYDNCTTQEDEIVIIKKFTCIIKHEQVYCFYLLTFCILMEFPVNVD